MASEGDNSCLNNPVILEQINSKLSILNESNQKLKVEISNYNQTIDSINGLNCGEKAKKITVTAKGNVSDEFFHISSEIEALKLDIKKRGEGIPEDLVSQTPEANQQSNQSNKDTIAQMQAERNNPENWPKTYNFWLDCSLDNKALTYDVILTYKDRDDQNNIISRLNDICVGKGGMHVGSDSYVVLHKGPGTKVYNSPVVSKSTRPSKKAFPKTYEINTRCNSEPNFKFEHRFLNKESQNNSTQIVRNECEKRFSGVKIENFGATFKLVAN